jgi:subtilisin family serine protease
MGTLTPQLAAVGGRVVAVYDQFGMFNVVFERPLANPEQFINSLRAHPAVQAVFHDKIVTADQVPLSYRPQVNSTGIDRVDADLSAAKSGDRVGPPVNVDIAIIDSGVYKNHPDLNVFRCVTLISYFDVKSGQMAHYDKPNECYDGLGHGTRVAGIAAAKDNNYGVVGTASGARIWAIKVLDNNGRGDESDTLAGLTYVAKYFKEIGVVNLSLGHFGCDSAITEAITRLVYKGNVVVVVAAGNENIDANSFTPACVPAAITVSAITDSDSKCGGTGAAIQEDSTLSQSHIQSPLQPNVISNPDYFVASYSNYGSVVDLAAPSGDILSTANTGAYKSIVGTSAAAPHVAGAAALIKSLHPNANPISIDEFLRTGTKAPAAGRPLISCDAAGRGYFDDRYLTTGVAGVGTDNIRATALYGRYKIVKSKSKINL